MTPQEFRTIRLELDLTQEQLTKVLGYNQRSYLAAFEATTKTVREIPPLLERLMHAYRDGYRPAGWPTGRPQRKVYMTKRRRLELKRAGSPDA